MAALDMMVWAKYLARRTAASPTDYQGHEDVPEDAALALVEALEPGDLRRLCDALLEAAPGFAERVTDAVLGDLKEEMNRRTEYGEFGGTAAELVEEIEADWRQQQ